MKRATKMDLYNRKYRSQLIYGLDSIADCAKVYRYHNSGDITIEQVVKEMKIIDKLKFVEK